MGKEIDLLSKYPKTKRDLSKRLENKTEDVRKIARKFGKDFFDGERKYGYGGFNYNPKYWSEVVKDFSNYYNLNDESKILDVGCAKGFMLYDFYKLNPQLDLHGVDVSKYAIDNSILGKIIVAEIITSIEYSKKENPEMISKGPRFVWRQ